MIVLLAGATDTSIDIQIVDDSGLPVTGLVSATFPTVKYSKGTGADATITTSDLSALTDAHSDGGVKERGEGVYRLDLPDAVASAVAPAVKIRGEATNKRVIAPEIQVASATRGLTGTAVPAVAAEAAGGLFTRGTGAGQIAQDFNGTVNVNATYMAGYSLGTTYTGNNFVTFFENALQFTAATVDNIGSILDDTGTAGVVVNAAGLATDAVQEIRNAITGGAYAFDTDANGRIRIVDGTGTGELDTSSGLVAITTAAINAIADQVWDEVLSGHLTGGTTGAGLNAAGSAGDPWGTALPGAYSAGTAGYIIGTNLNGTITSRASQSSLDTLDDYVDTEVAAITTELAKVPKSDGTATWNATALASINTQCDTALTDYDGPTNAELATALGTADDATLAAIAALNNLSSAQVQTAAAAALNAYDPPTNAEMEARTLLAAAYGTAANQTTIIGYVDDIGVAGAGLTAIPWNAAWDAEVQSEVTDALNAALTEAYRSAGATGSVAQLLYEISAHLGRSAFASTTKTIYKLNNTTPAKTFTLDNATPTAIEETT